MPNRQALTAMLKKFATTAIEKSDRQYGRLLATLCEKTAVQLRAAFGGKSALLLSKSPQGSDAEILAWRVACAADEPDANTLIGTGVPGAKAEEIVEAVYELRKMFDADRTHKIKLPNGEMLNLWLQWPQS